MNEPTRNRGRSAAPRVLLVQPDVELRRPVLHRTFFIQAACGANRKDWNVASAIARVRDLALETGAAVHRSLCVALPNDYRVTDGRQRVSAGGFSLKQPWPL